MTDWTFTFTLPIDSVHLIWEICILLFIVLNSKDKYSAIWLLHHFIFAKPEPHVMQGKHFTTQLYPQPLIFKGFIFSAWTISSIHQYTHKTWGFFLGGYTWWCPGLLLALLLRNYPWWGYQNYIGWQDQTHVGLMQGKYPSCYAILPAQANIFCAHLQLCLNTILSLRFVTNEK